MSTVGTAPAASAFPAGLFSLTRPLSILTAGGSSSTSSTPGSSVAAASSSTSTTYLNGAHAFNVSSLFSAAPSSRSYYSTHELTDPTEMQKAIPLTYMLQESRGSSMTGIQVNVRKRSITSQELDATNTPVRTPCESWIELGLNFRQSESLRSRYVLFNTEEVRLGKIIEDLDALAADIAYRHYGDDSLEKVTIVTAGLDRVIIKGSLSVANDLRLTGRVTWVGSSSCEVRIDITSFAPRRYTSIHEKATAEGEKVPEALSPGAVEKEGVAPMSPLNTEKEPQTNTNTRTHHETAYKQEGRPVLIGQAYFLMVCRKKTGHGSTPFPALKPIHTEEIQAQELGSANRQKRKMMAERSLNREPPSLDETLLVHQLHLIRKEKRPEIYQHYHVKDMESCKSSSIHIMQYQDRNIHGRAFGGHLMRLAFELAWSNVWIHTGLIPSLKYIDDNRFIYPVEIGSVARFSTSILCSNPEQRTVFVKVQAHIVEPRSTTEKMTNEFYFGFQIKPPEHGSLSVESNASATASNSSANGNDVSSNSSSPTGSNTSPLTLSNTPQDGKFDLVVMPSSYEEAINYLDGRRREHFLASLDQLHLGDRRVSTSIPALNN